MGEHTEDTDDQVRGLIRAHLREHGEVDMRSVVDAAAALGYARSEVEVLARPIATAYRAARAAEPAGAADFPEPVIITPKAARKAVAAPLEFEPLQSYIHRIKRIDADAQMLRQSALVADDSAAGFKIKFPNTFLAAIHHQEEALKLHMKVGEALFTLDRVESYFRSLGEIIRDRTADVDPDLRAAIMDDFKKLNDEFMGMGSR